MAGQPWVPGVWGLMSASWPASGLPDFVVPRATPLVSAHSPGLRNPGPAFPDPAAVVPSLLLTACGGPAPAWLVFSWWHGPQGPVRYANSLRSHWVWTTSGLSHGLTWPSACFFHKPVRPSPLSHGHTWKLSPEPGLQSRGSSPPMSCTLLRSPYPSACWPGPAPHPHPHSPCCRSQHLLPLGRLVSGEPAA